jgi:hypothetical protein
MTWGLFGTPEFFEWYETLAPDATLEIAAALELLGEFGPGLKRPHADTLGGSKITNLKELRASTASAVLRCTFYFDEKRQGILLIGGDKHGKDGKAEEKFYKDLIKKSENLLEKYKDYTWGEENKWPKP